MKTKVEWRLPMGLAGIVTLCLALFCCFPGPGFCEDKYGAIAYSSGARAWGWSYDYDTQEEAENRALAECNKRGSGCKVVNWFRNACGALANGSNGAWGCDWAESKEEAIRKAIERCQIEGGSNCRMRCWACTER